MVKEIDVDLTHVFRQEILKLANSYNPKFEYQFKHKDIDTLVNNFTDEVIKDFSEQLRPLLIKSFTDAIHQEL